MSFCIKPSVCKKCGKPLTLFEGWHCLECEKAEQDIPTMYYPQVEGITPTVIKPEPCEDAVSRGAFEQVMYERDIAIEQLKELGYEWGEKIEPCDDAVSRQAAIQIFDRWLEIGDYNYSERNIMNCAISEIKDLPSVQPKRQAGKWIEIDSDDPCWYMCSECHRQSDIKENFCPSCGAKMESEDKE